MLVVAALYCFTPLDPEAEQPSLKAFCQDWQIKGSLLLAREGINGTVAGSRRSIDALNTYIRKLAGNARLSYKESTAEEIPFQRMKVRLKKEIVTMGKQDVDPNQHVGRYVAPKDWNTVIAREDMVIIDTRNEYECAMGTFAGAINPHTRSFREFPDWWQDHKQDYADKPVAMFCTGGIRCEKASNYLLSQGVKEVYHLEGGILQYLEDIDEEKTLWQGDCYVFDKRLALSHGLKEADYVPCHACGIPLKPEETTHPSYEEGVSCHHCADQTPEHRKAAFRMRHQQMMTKPPKS